MPANMQRTRVYFNSKRRYRPRFNNRRRAYRPRNGRRNKLPYIQDDRNVQRQNRMNTSGPTNPRPNNRRYNRRSPPSNNPNMHGKYNNRTRTSKRSGFNGGKFLQTGLKYGGMLLEHYLKNRKSEASGIPPNGPDAPLPSDPVELHSIASLYAPIDDAKKRTVIVEASLLTFFHNLARGWYAAIKKSCINFGRPNVNDKYFPTGLVARANNERTKHFFGSDTLMVNFLHNLIICNYNYAISNNVTKLLTRLPHHISFSIHVAATKMLIRVKNGVANIAVRIPSYIIKDETKAVSDDPIIAYLTPTDYIAGNAAGNPNVTAQMISEVPNILNALFAVQQHEAYPFKTTDELVSYLPGLSHFDADGKAVPVNLNLSEIVSVYGYAADTLSTYPGKYIHDLSGLVQTRISNVFRYLFFPQFIFQDATEYTLLPDSYNDKLSNNYYFDNYKLAIYFGCTAVIPNVDYLLTANMPLYYADNDVIRAGPTESSILSSVNSKALNYFTTRYNSNNTKPAAYKPPTRAAPGFHAALFSPHTYNFSIAMAQKMQNRICESSCTTAGLPGYSESCIDTFKYCKLYFKPFYSVASELHLRSGAWILQYDGRFVLPSPIVEDMKPYNTINTWTYRGGTESIGIQLLQFAMQDLYISYNPDNSSFQSNLNDWTLKPQPYVPTRDFLYSPLDEYYQSYDGLAYSPANYDRILNLNDVSLNEIRSYIKLNNVPELENTLPSMHTMYASLVSEASSDQYSILDSYNIYTPLTGEDFTKKNIAIFIKVALLPVLQTPDNINIPMTNVMNYPLTYYSDSARYTASLTQEKALYALCQYSFEASYNGASSELDYYYEALRRSMIGSWSDLAPMFQEALGQSIGGIFPVGDSAPGDALLNKVYSFLPNITKLMGTPIALNSKGRENIKKGKLGPMGWGRGLKKSAGGKLKALGANGDLQALLSTILRSVSNFDENGGITVNTPKTNQDKGFDWGSLLGLAVQYAPKIAEML